MTSASVIKLYVLLSEKIGKENAENLIEYIDKRIETMYAQPANIFDSKDLLNEKFELKSDILSLKTDIFNMKYDLFYWMLFLSVTQIITTVSFVVFFLK